MERTYINGDEVRITKTGFCLVKLEFYNGPTFENLEPRRLFPISGLRNYITLLDKDLYEKAIIRSIDNLMPDSKKAIEDCLAEYYMIPQITKLNKIQEQFGVLMWEVETNRGTRKFNIKNRSRDIKALYDGRILVCDSDDNRYEIPDINALDAKSRHMLNNEL